MPAAGRRTQLFLFIFTEPGVHLLVHPCSRKSGERRRRAGGEKVIAPIYQLARPASLPSIYLSESERERAEQVPKWLAGWPKEREKTRSVNISELIVSGRRFRAVVNMKSPCTIRFCNLCYVQKLIKAVLSAECFSGLLLGAHLLVG